MAIGKTLLFFALSLPWMRAECADFKPLSKDKFSENRKILTSLTPLFLGLADKYLSEDIWATMSSDLYRDSEGKGFSKKLLEYTRDTCDGDFLVLLNRVISDQKRYGSFCEFFYEVNEYLKKYCPKINEVFSFTSQNRPKGSLNLMEVLNMAFQSRFDFFQAFLDKMGSASEEYSKFCTTNKCEEANGVLFSLYQFLSGTLGNDSALFHPLLDFVITHKRQAEAAIPFLMRTLLCVKGQKELPQVIKIPVLDLYLKKEYPPRVFGAGMTFYEFHKQTGEGLAEYQRYLDSGLNRGSANVKPDGKVFSVFVYKPWAPMTDDECRKQVIDEDFKLCSCDITEAQEVALEVLRVIIRQLEVSMTPDDAHDFLYDPNKSLVDNRLAYVQDLLSKDFETVLRGVLENDVGTGFLKAILDDQLWEFRDFFKSDVTDDDCRSYDRVWPDYEPLSNDEKKLAISMSRWIRRNLHFLDSSDPRPVDDLTLSKYVLYTPLDDGHGFLMSDFVKDIARQDLEHLKTVYAERLRHLPSELDIPFWSRLQAATADHLASALHVLMIKSYKEQYRLQGDSSTNGLSLPIQTLITSFDEVLERKQIPQSHGAAFFLNNILTVCEPKTVRETLLLLIRSTISSYSESDSSEIDNAQYKQDATDFVRFSRIIWAIDERLEGIKDSNKLDFDHVGNFRNNEVTAIFGKDSCKKAIDYWRQQREKFLIYDHATHTYPHLFTVFPFYYDFMPEMSQSSPEGDPNQPNS